jgi:hypothetical protein
VEQWGIVVSDNGKRSEVPIYYTRLAYSPTAEFTRDCTERLNRWTFESEDASGEQGNGGYGGRAPAAATDIPQHAKTRKAMSMRTRLVSI